MMTKLLNWLDDRTGVRALMHEALFERIPGGARWRYVWGSTLVFTFAVQVITGMFLWMAYSPSAQTAWESVYYIQFQMDGGWLLRGIHHYTAQAMVVLMALHLMQVVIDGAYRAPREINFWLGLILMKIVLGLALTGYLLPWDQKGYWATQVATKIAGIVPLVGPSIQELIVGGKEYGHHTLTRFFALHAGVLPALLVAFLALHVAMFRKHGITPKLPLRKRDQFFWPEQVLKDAVACLAVLITVVLLSIFLRAELGAPADPADSYKAARPEWYFLFLFQFLKLFHGEMGELVGAIVVPGVIMLLLFLMPIIGRSRAGHWLNVALIFLVVAGAGALTGLAVHEDYQSRWVDDSQFDGVKEMLAAVDADGRKNGAKSEYRGKQDSEMVSVYVKGDEEKAKAMLADLRRYRAFQKSQSFLESTTAARQNADRAHELASDENRIPPQGALYDLHQDAKLQGPRLFANHCAGCHDHAGEEGVGIRRERALTYKLDPAGNWLSQEPPLGNAAPNLDGFASRKWIAGLLDPDKIAHADVDTTAWLVKNAPYFGNTKHREGDMAGFVKDNLKDLPTDKRATVDKIVAALSAEAKLPAQRELDATAERDGTLEAGRKAIATFDFGGNNCTTCHKFHDAGEAGSAPDLTGYGSREWLTGIISNPGHDRFYGDNNDRMPAFAASAEKPEMNLLTPEEVRLLVDWLRGEWYEPTSDE